VKEDRQSLINKLIETEQRAQKALSETESAFWALCSVSINLFIKL
jgi:hypothetical protein